MTRTKWQDVLEHARYFAKMDWLEGIKPESWKEKNAMRELEDHLRLNSIWTKYEGTDEEKEIDLCPDCNVYCLKRFIDGRCE